MNIKITADYTGETREILICSHETVGDTMSIMAENLTFEITKDQAKNLISRLTIAINMIEEYAKMVKRSGTAGNGT